jgi:hypothetical protein
VFGNSVNVKVAALNLYGSSGFSAVGSGGLIQLVPDSPVSLANAAAITSATQIGLTWSLGSSNGGSTVIDYRIYYD